jgi:hypothetical protein
VRPKTLVLVCVGLALGCGGERPSADGSAEQQPDSEQPAPPAGQPDASAPTPHDWLVVADTRIGPVTAETSERALIELLGAANVERREAHIGEGFCAPGSALYPGKADEVEVLWGDTTYTEPATVRVSGAGSRWRSVLGVQVGTALAELERIAGGPVQFSGFGWDYGGGASWTEPAGQGGGEGTIVLQLAPDPDSFAALAREPGYREVIGERQVRSDHPIVRRLNVRVERMSVPLGRPVGGEHECRLP